MNFFHQASIKRKQVLIIMAITSVALLLACAGFTTYEVLAFRSAMVQNLSTLAKIIGNNTAGALDFDDFKAAAETLSALKAESHIVGACVYSADGKVFATYRSPAGGAAFTLPSAPPVRNHAFRDGVLTLSRPIVSKGDIVGTVYLVSDSGELYSRLGQYAAIIAAVLALTLIVALGLSRKLQQLISEPILQLARAARAVGQNKDYSIRAKKHHPDEIGVLIDGFNGMLEQIQERDMELQKAKDVLEARVEERTAELAGANAALQKENLERKQAEAAVRRTEELYRRAISGADAVPYAYDGLTKSYLFIDERIEQLIGYTPDQITPALWKQIVQESVMRGETAGLDKDEAAKRVIRSEIRIWRCDMRVLTRHGITRWISDASVHSFDESGHFVGSVGILQDITDRKQAEETLRSQEERTRLIIDQAFDAVITADIDYRVIGWNRQAEKMLGWAREDILGRNLFDTIIPPSRREARRAVLARFRATGEWPDLNRLIETTEICRDGRELPVELTITPIRLGDHCIFTIFLRDITERKQAEAALAQERHLLESLLKNTSDGIYFKDRQSRFLRCSQQTSQRFGGGPAEIIGKTDFDVFTEEHARPAFEDEQEIIRSGRPLIGKVEKEVGKDGRESWALTSKWPLRDMSGEIVGTFGISKDITAIKQTEAAFAQERHLLECLLKNTSDCIYFKDRQSRFLRCSQPQSQRFGGGPAELIGKTDFDVFTEEHARPAFEDEQEIIRSGRPLIGKVEREVAKDGRESWALTSKWPLRDMSGEIVGTFGVSKDITAMKQAETELEQIHKELVLASRVAGMAEVATNVLHNVGNVLNSINVSATLVDEQVRKSRVADVRRLAKLLQEHAEDRAAFLTSDPKGQRVPDFIGHLAEKLGSEQTAVLEELTSLRKNVEHVKEIIAMQQSYSRLSGVFENIKVADLLEDTLRMHASALARHDVKVVRDFTVLPPICTDKHKVLQILINLVRNAKYACDESGRSDKQLILRVTAGEGRVKIAVLDNGVGILPENLTRIFNHGFSTRKDGHGFGLHSGALAAKELGGSLTAYSEGRGRGAVFTLELPCQPSAGKETKMAQNRPRDNLATP